MKGEQAAKVIDSLVNFIERVANEKRPTKEEVEVLPEVVRALKEFTTLQRFVVSKFELPSVSAIPLKISE